ncbi:hypothetical protein GEMRC1_008377 [Eukaryota sp. GEM-RC1]
MSFAAPSVSPSYISFGSLHSAAAARRSRDVSFNDERFPPVINSAFRKLFMLLKETNDDCQWQSVEIPDNLSTPEFEQFLHQTQFSIEQKLLPGVCCYAVRASIIIKDNFSPSDFLEHIRTPNEERRIWDGLYNEGTILETIDDRINVVYTKRQSLSPRILRPTDSVLMQAVRPARDGSFFLVEVSAQYETAPKSSGYNRLTVPMQGWVIRKMYDNEYEIKFASELNPDQYLPSFARHDFIAHTVLQPLKLTMMMLQQQGSKGEKKKEDVQ